MSEKHGGSAFPVLPPDTHNYREWPASEGMTLRDYFAAKALAACWGNEHNRSRALDDSRNAGRILYDQMAIEAYAVADAMLRARKDQP